MAALAFDQGEGKHPPGPRPREGPLEAPAGAEAASEPDLLLRATHPSTSLPAWQASALRRRRTEPPAGGPRLPGRAPGGSRGPQGAHGLERPLARGPADPAPLPPLSRLPPPPAWVILRLGALRGRSPETPSSTSPLLAFLPLLAAPRPLSPPAALSRPSRQAPPGAVRPLVLARPGPAPTPRRLPPSPTVLTRDSALSSFPGLVLRGSQARRLAPRRSALARPGSGPF